MTDLNYLCVPFKKHSRYLLVFTVWARGLKGGKLFVCVFLSGSNAFKHKYKTINKSQGTKAVHLTQQSYDQLGTAKLNGACPGPEGQ